jgi:3-oxoadipate enol-lactonase
VELNVATWLGPEASEEWRERLREMQRHALAVQLAAEAGGDGPEAARVDPSPTEVTAPTVVVSGDLDMDHFRNIAIRLSAEIPDCRLVTLPWAAHLPSLERPDETSVLIAGALESVAAQ